MFALCRCSLWLKYAILSDEKAVIIVNSIGATLFFLYVLVFWVYTINKRAVCRQLLCVFVVLGLTIAYTQWYEKDKAEAIDVVGNGQFSLFIDFSHLSPFSALRCAGELILFVHSQAICAA